MKIHQHQQKRKGLSVKNHVAIHRPLPGITLEEAKRSTRSFEFANGKLGELRASEQGAIAYPELVAKLSPAERDAWDMIEGIGRGAREKVALRFLDGDPRRAVASDVEVAARQTREIMELWAFYQAMLETGNEERVNEWLRELSAAESIVLGLLMISRATKTNHTIS